jgi:phosphoribosyl 1,2-cyclic phosphodiesterase
MAWLFYGPVMKFSVLGSSSKGNCTFIEHTDRTGGVTRILVDCGHSARQIENRLRALGVEASSIDAVLISHEHTDHVQGLPVFTRRFGTPIYVSNRTRRVLPRLPGISPFESGESFGIGNLEIQSFHISHDAVDPVGFVISAGGARLGIATDLGEVTPQVDDALTELDALILESNYDPELLATCGYPWSLQQRIASIRGHLQNEAAAQFLLSRTSPRLRSVVLAHLSENSNTPHHAHAAMVAGLGAIDPLLWPLVRCASPAVPTELSEVGSAALAASDGVASLRTEVAA